MLKLKLSKLRKQYASFAAVDDIDLDLEKGEFVSLLGPSGCGKTTTLRMIAGFVEPSGGTIEMNGRLLSKSNQVVPPEKRGMSMIFQSYAIWPNMTVFENVGFGLRMRKVARAELTMRVERVLDTVQLSHLASRYPNELSGGQQQRVALARSIVVEPEILLLDEPLSNLDANLREEMRSEIRKLHDEFKMTTVYVTHDQSEAMAVSDRVAVMSQGRIEQVDRPYEIYSRPKTRFVAGFIGRTNLLDGTLSEQVADLGALQVPVGRLPEPPKASSFTASLRPQDIKLSANPDRHDSFITIEGEIKSATFLGETWDYTVCPKNGEHTLRVSAPASAVFPRNGVVWLSIDPVRIFPISE